MGFNSGFLRVNEKPSSEAELLHADGWTDRRT